MSGKKIIWIIVLVIVVFIGYRIATSKKKAKIIGTDTSVPVYVQKVTRGNIMNVIEASGDIVPSLQADIFSRVPGKLICNLVEEGDPICINQEIAQIDRDEIGVSFTTAAVKSTINGILLKHYLDPGSKVSPLSPIATVGDTSKVKAVIELSENDFTKVKRGTKAYVSVDSYPGRKFAGEVTLVAPQIDLLSRTGKVEILVDNTKQELKPGMFAVVELIMSAHSDSIVIPRSAVIEDGDARKVYVVDEGKAKEKVVTIGLSDDSSYEILSGVQAGEELITEGQHTLKNGDTVRIVTE